MGKGFVMVEGQGEKDAVQNLITRLWTDLGLPQTHWSEPWRYSSSKTKEHVIQACNRLRRRGDVAALLVLRDADDDCPKTLGPEMAQWLRAENLPFPSAAVLLCREYETLFLPCLASMGGTPLPRASDEKTPGMSFSHDYERRRGVKELLRKHLPSKRYKPTLDQLMLTRSINFNDIRSSGLPSFGTLERALGFLAGALGEGGVYPPPPA